MPRDITEVDLRTKDIRYSSRTRQGTDQFKKQQQLRRAVSRLLKQMPSDRRNDPEWKLLEAEADEKVYNIAHLIYRASRYEGSNKDFEFSRRSMQDHWRAGYHDTVRTLRHPEVLDARPIPKASAPSISRRTGESKIGVQTVRSRARTGQRRFT